MKFYLQFKALGIPTMFLVFGFSSSWQDDDWWDKSFQVLQFLFDRVSNWIKHIQNTLEWKKQSRTRSAGEGIDPAGIR